MKIIKKLAALLMAVLLVLSLASCHKAGAIAATYGKYEMTSGVYLALFIDADMDARNTVYEQLKKAEADTTDIDYTKQKIGDQSFADYVRSQTTEAVKRFFYVEETFDKMGLKLTDEDNANIANQAAYYWNYYGYSMLFEDNGVSEDSYTVYMTNQYKMSKILTTLYGEGGDKAISAADMKKGLTDNYLIANSLAASFYDEKGVKLSKDELAKLKTKLEGYADRLKKGESFEKIYKEYNNIKDEDIKEDSSDNTPKPKDIYASVFSNSQLDSSYSTYFSKLAAVKTGEITVLDLSDCYMLVVKQDITADPYYAEAYNDSLITILKGEEFEKDVNTAAGKLKVEINSYETDYFKVSKIVYPEATY